MTQTEQADDRRERCARRRRFAATWLRATRTRLFEV